MKNKNKIKIKVNGKYMIIKQKASVQDLIKALKIPLGKIAIEMNREILDKKKLTAHIETIQKIIPDADSSSILNAALKLPDIFSSNMPSVSKSSFFAP